MWLGYSFSLYITLIGLKFQNNEGVTPDAIDILSNKYPALQALVQSKDAEIITRLQSLEKQSVMAIEDTQKPRQDLLDAYATMRGGHFHNAYYNTEDTINLVCRNLGIQ